MSGTSNERINYSLRPAKQVERKMLCEAFRRLASFDHVDSYRYVGFGGLYFSDMVLVHKTLGIKNLVSIERDYDQRFEFNKPYDCIDIKDGAARDELPKLSWAERTILWLDYDDALNDEILGDVSLACSRLVSGSMLVVTVQAHPAAEGKRLAKLTTDVGRLKVPCDVTSEADLQAWNTAGVHARILSNEIAEALVTRNGGRGGEPPFRFDQVFHFRYADGVKMVTLGGLLYSADADEEDRAKACRFDEFRFFRPSTDPYLIHVPKLTYRETRYLDQRLPVDGAADLARIAEIPPAELAYYEKIYRYFPTFAEADL